MPFFTRFFPLSIAVMLGLCSLAAAPAEPPVKDWSDVEVVVVTPDHPGPALWHIAQGNSEVWILPTVSPFPKDLQWDSHEVQEALQGSNALLLPPRGQVGFFEGLWFYTWDMDTLEQPDGTTLESTLPEPLRDRFVATRKSIDQDDDRYSKYLGGVAAVMLENDYWKFAKLTPNGPQKTLESLASNDSVPAHPTAVYPAMDVIKDVPKMTAAAHLACLEFAIGDIATATAHARAAAEAWAVGNLDGVKANYMETKLDDCLQQNAAYIKLRESANRDMANAIETALKKPGKTFAVMPMGFFLRKGGVLERLKAAGLTVSGPGG